MLAAVGPAGTADGSAAWPAVRLFPLNSVLTRSLLAMPWVKSDITLKRVSPILPDGSYRAEIAGDGPTVAVRLIEYFADVEGQQVPEMLCLVPDLLDWEEYPARELAGLCKWRCDGSETGLREAKAPLHGAGPGTGAVPGSGSPELIAREIAAWTAATEMTRGVARDAAAAAQPAAKGRRAGQPVRYRDLSLTRARRLILAAIRSGTTSYKALAGQIARFRASRNSRRKPQTTRPASGNPPSGDAAPRLPPGPGTGGHAPSPTGKPPIKA